MIRKAVFTSASIQDNEVAEDLISGDEAAVYADRISESKVRRARLKERGIKDRIMHRRHKYMPALPPWQAVRNSHSTFRRGIPRGEVGAKRRVRGLGSQ